MILVTGATGRLGGNIVRMLRQARAEVRCLVRIGSEYFWLNETGTHYFFGDLRNLESLKRATQGCTHIIHAAGIRLESTDNHHGVTTLQGTKDLIDVAVKRQIRHFVLVSCVCVDEPEGNPELEFRAEVEEYLIQSGLNYSILRFSLFTDEFADLVHEARRKEKDKIWVWGDGSAKSTPIWRRDAAIYSIAALDHPAMKNCTLHVGGPEEVEIQDAVQQTLSQSGESFDVEFWGGWKASAAAKGVSMIGGQRWQNYIRRRNAAFGRDTVVDMSELQESVGIPLTPFSQALEASLAEEHPSMDPESRDTRVVHRQFQATVYEPGEIQYAELPEGPLVMTEEI